MQRYGAYKDSGVEWIGEIPAGWGVVPGGEYCLLQAGFPFDSGLFSATEGVPLIRIRDITSGRAETFYCGDFDKSYLVNNGDLLVGMDGDFSVRMWESGRALLNQRCCRLLPKTEKVVRFLYWMIPLALTEIHNLKYSTTVKHLANGDILHARFPLPPLPEQQAIADYLDDKTAEIDSIVSQTERSIGLLREYRKSVISEAVTKGLDPDAPMKGSGVEWIGEIPAGWACLKVKNCCDYWNGLTYSPDDISESGTRVLRSSNVQDGKLVYEDSVFVDMDVPEKAMAYPGDVLICSRNGSKSLIGKNALIDSEGNAFGAFMMIARPRCNCRYFFYLLNSGVFDFYLPTYLTSTVNQLTGGNFGQMVVPFSKNECEQQAIADYLDAKTAEIDSLIDAKQRQVELLKEYRKSLISEAVTGKFKVPGLE